MRKGFIIEEQQIINSKQELKSILKKFVKEISSTNLKAKIDKIDTGDKFYVNIKLMIVCLQDKWLDHYDDFIKKKKFCGCASSFRLKNEYEIFVNKLVLKYFDDNPRWNSFRSNGFSFYINNFKKE